mgnify:CR=1 FL=1
MSNLLTKGELYDLCMSKFYLTKCRGTMHRTSSMEVRLNEYLIGQIYFRGPSLVRAVIPRTSDSKGLCAKIRFIDLIVTGTSTMIDKDVERLLLDTIKVNPNAKDVLGRVVEYYSDRMDERLTIET